MKVRLLFCSVAMILCYYILIMHMSTIVLDSDTYSAISDEQYYYTVEVGSVYGTIYDAEYSQMVNTENSIMAVVYPTQEATKELKPYVLNVEEYSKKLSTGRPFAIEVSKADYDSKDIITFNVPKRYSNSQIAQHIIGYSSDGVGVCGLERSYSDFLHSANTTYTVKYAQDGYGNIIHSVEPIVSYNGMVSSGVVTTLDSHIQKICEDAMQGVEKGACIVADVNSGQIKAIVSVPTYDVLDLESSLNSPDMLFINRVLSSHSCGSIFKLVTTGVALECGISESFNYCCNGSLNVCGQCFNCHKLDGHGVQDMRTAIKNSCNTYFIELSQLLDNYTILDYCKKLGFGRQTIFTKDIASDSGYLPTVQQLRVPAEKGNFSFGQGLLTVTPVQIASLTCAIANDGNMPILYLVNGLTDDGSSLHDVNYNRYTKVFSWQTAKKLQSYMRSSVQDNCNSLGIPCNTTASGKTSTAQTGIFNADGTEVCQAWITGYFPCENPKYSVTVLVENGEYGNTTSAPIFKQIIETITACGL